MAGLFRSLLLALCLVAVSTFAAGAAGFGLSGGDQTSGGAPAVEGLFKSSPGQAAPAPEFDTDELGVRPAQPAPVGRSVELVYNGHAHADDRRAQINLTIAPDGRATGTISIQSVCEPNVHLGGADLTFSGVLSGTWESKGASIDGTWQGTEHFCGTNSPNNGTFKFFRNEANPGKPVLHLRLIGRNGQYGWDFPPTDKVYIAAGAALPSGATSAPATGKTDAKKPVTEGEPPVELDPDRVTGILVVPLEVPLMAGEKAELPRVLAIIGDSADKVPVPEEMLEWRTDRGLSVSGGEFETSSTAKDGDRLRFTVRARLSLTKIFDAAGVVHVSSGPFGSIEGRVVFYYNYPRYQGEPGRPFQATVELRPGGGPALRTVTTGPDGAYRFDRLPQGNYQIVVTGFKAAPYPAGYRLKVQNGPWYGVWVGIPKHKRAFEPDPATAQWDFTGASTTIDLLGPDYQIPKAVTGRVTYHGQGIAGVTVMANRVGSEGGEKSVTSGQDGSYLLEIKGMEPGTYWLRAQKFVVRQWAGPDDLLDVASARDQRSVLFTVPFFAADRVEIDIEVLTRNEIFGGDRTPEQPVDLP